MFRTESAEHPSVASIAQSIYDRLLEGEPVDYRSLDHLFGEASGKGVLRAIRAKYGPDGQEAILAPIMDVIACTKPIRSTRPDWTPAPGEDPLAVQHQGS